MKRCQESKSGLANLVIVEVGVRRKKQKWQQIVTDPHSGLQRKWQAVAMRSPAFSGLLMHASDAFLKPLGFSRHASSFAAAAPTPTFFRLTRSPRLLKPLTFRIWEDRGFLSKHGNAIPPSMVARALVAACPTQECARTLCETGNCAC